EKENKDGNKGSWKNEGNNIMRACKGCDEHISNKLTKGVIKAKKKEITELMVNRKRLIYKKLEDIIRVFKLRRELKYEISQEEFMTKSQKKSWKFIKQFKNISEILWKKCEEMQRRDTYNYRIIERTKKKGKKRFLYL
ncbi:45117_t:CDS:2, partial [Gigaspora margarita]